MSVNLGTATAKLVVNAGPFSQGLAQAEKSLAGFQGRTQTVGFGLSELGRTLGAAGGTIAAGLVLATKVAADFQEAMLNVASISKDVAGNLEGFSRQILDLATTSARSPEELAKALYQVVSAGIAASDAIDIVAISAKAATAGLSDTATAATAITAVLNAGIKDAAGNFLNAQQAADKLFEIVDKGVFTFPELAAQIGDVTALAGELGLNIDDIGAAFITLSQIGVKASEVPTQLVAILNSILKPTTDFTAALGAMGLTTQDLIDDLGKPGGLGDVLAVVDEITKGNAADIGKVTSNIRAIKGELGLASKEGATFARAEDDMAHSAGALDEALKQQRKSLNFALRDLRVNVTAFAISIGNAFVPALTAAAHAFTALTKAINTIPQPIKQVIAFFAAGVATFLLAGSALAFLTQKIFNILAALRILSEIGVIGILPFSALVRPVKLLTSGFGLFGTGLIGIVSPLRLVGTLFSALLSPLKILTFLVSPLVNIVKSLGLFFGLFRLALVAATGPLDAIVLAVGLVTAALTTILGPILAVVAALTLLGAAIGIAADAHGAWSKLSDNIGGLFSEISSLLGLGGPLKEFFGIAAKGTTQTNQKKTLTASDGILGFNLTDVKHQAQALLAERHKFRDKLAASVGRGGTHTTVTGTHARGIGFESEDGTGIVTTRKTRRDVAFLKQLDRALKDTGKEARSWTTKFQIGRRAARDFFEFLGSGKTRNGLKVFKERLQDVFGKKAGNDIFAATQKMRDGIEKLNAALSSRLGIANVLSLAGGLLLLIRGFNAVSKLIRTAVVPALGEMFAIVLKLGADVIDLAANIIGGDFSGALDAFIALIKDSFTSIIIPVTSILVDASSAVVDWVTGKAPDIAQMILGLLFGKGQSNPTGDQATKFGGGGATPGTTVDTQGAVGWLLHIAEPSLVGWIQDHSVSDVVDLILLKVFGRKTSELASLSGGESGAQKIDTGVVIGWTLGTAEPTLSGWVLGGLKAISNLLGKAFDKITGGAPVVLDKVIHFILNVGEPFLLNKAGDLFTKVKNLLSPEISSISGKLLGTIDKARVQISDWFVTIGSDVVSLLDRAKDFTLHHLPDPGAIFGTIEKAVVSVASWFVQEGSGLGQIFDQVVSFVSDRLPPAKDVFGKIEGAIVQILSWFISLADETTDLLSKVKDFVTSQIPSRGEVLGTIASVLVWIEDWSIDLALGTMDLEQKAKNWVFDHLPSASDVLGTIVQAVVEISDWLIQGASELATLTDKAESWIKSHIPGTDEVLGTIESAIVEIKDWFVQDLGDIHKKIQEHVDTHKDDAFNLAVGNLDVNFGTFKLNIPKLFDFTSPGKAFSLSTDDVNAIQKGAESIGAAVGKALVDGIAAFFSFATESNNEKNKDLAGIADKLAHALIGGVIALVTNIDFGKEKKDSSGNDAIGAAILGFLKGFFVAGFNEAINKIGDSDWWKKEVIPTGELTKSLFSGLTGALGDIFRDPLKEILTSPGDLGHIGSGQGAVGGSTGPQGSSSLVSDWIQSAIIDPIVKAASSVKNWGQDIVDALFASFGTPDFSALGKTIWDGIKGAVIAAVTPGFIQDIIDSLKGKGTSVDTSSQANTGCPDGTHDDGSGNCVPDAISTGSEEPLSLPSRGAATAKSLLGNKFPLTVAISDILKFPNLILPSAASDSFIGSIKTMFTTTQADAVVGGTGIAVATGTGINTGATGPGGALVSTQNLGTGVLNIFKTTATDAGTEGTNTGTNYGTGIGAAVDIAAAAAGNLVAAALGSFQAGGDAAFADGQNVGNSYALGISSMAEAAAAAGASLAAASQQGTASANKQGSPSKVFMDFGRNAGVGYAIGLGLTNDLARAAGIAMAKASLPSLPRGIKRDPSIILEHGGGSAGPAIHNPTFIMPNLNTADQVERYFRRLSTVG